MAAKNPAPWQPLVVFALMISSAWSLSFAGAFAVESAELAETKAAEFWELQSQVSQVDRLDVVRSSSNLLALHHGVHQS